MRKTFIILYTILFITSSFAELTIDQVLKSASTKIPEIAAAQAQIEKARFEYIQALGSFYTKLKVGSSNEALGGYQASSNKMMLEKPTESGVQLFGGYRIGR